MKRRSLHYDPQQKLFTEKSATTIPRLLSPQEEMSFRKYEDRTRKHLKHTPVSTIMNWVKHDLQKQRLYDEYGKEWVDELLAEYPIEVLDVLEAMLKQYG